MGERLLTFPHSFYADFLPSIKFYLYTTLQNPKSH